MARGRFEIRKLGEDYYRVNLGSPEVEGPDAPALKYRLEVNGDAKLENIGMEAWPPGKTDGKYVFSEAVWAFPADSFYASNLSFATLIVKSESEVEHFDVYFVDETVEPTKEILWGRNRGKFKVWRGPIGLLPLHPAFLQNTIWKFQSISPMFQKVKTK